MPSDPTLDQVRTLIREVLGAVDAPPSFSSALQIPLIQPGKVLGNADRPLWAMIVLAACVATGGDRSLATRVAAGVELAMVALDLLDEIEDGDDSPTVTAVGVPQAMNVATALILLSQQVLLALPQRAGLPAPADFICTLTNATLIATVGQHRDLASEGSAIATTEEALSIARQKAGSLTGMACRLGAMVGTAEADLLDLYQAWGMHYGTAAQLGNDLHDALDEDSKSDIERRKSTLPLLFNRQSTPAASKPSDVAASGALHFTWVVVEIERDACRSLTEQLASRGQEVTLLRQIVR